MKNEFRKADPKFSIVVCSINEKKFSDLSANFTHVMGKESYEIIGIHDAKSLCEGYNRGFKQCRGSIVVFCHDDIEILSQDFASKLQRHLRRVDIVGPVGTSYLVDGYWTQAGSPYLHGQVGHYQPEEPVKYFASVYDFAKASVAGETLTTGMHALDGLFMAVNRKVMERVSFDEQTFDGFHLYDVDFTYCAFLAGLNIGAFTDIAIIHYSKNLFGQEFEKYNSRFLEKHRSTLLKLVTKGENSAKVLYETKEKLASSFDLKVRRHLAMKFAKIRGEKLEVSRFETIFKCRLHSVLMWLTFRRH